MIRGARTSSLAEPGFAGFAAPFGIDRENAVFQTFTVNLVQEPKLLLWTQSACLVTTPAIARDPSFAMAAARSAQRGWPVFKRLSGGTTVFHGDDTLCVSLLQPCPAGGPVTDAGYRSLTTLLVNALASLGIRATTGPVPEAPCDGRFNVVARGRKLAGTAMRVRTVHGRPVLLAHAVLLVGGGGNGLTAVRAFESDLGQPRAYRDDGCIGVAELLGRKGHEPSLRGQVADAIRRCFIQQSGDNHDER